MDGVDPSISNSRPPSNASSRIPSQLALRANFSRPVTAATSKQEPIAKSDLADIEDSVVEQVLITELQEILADRDEESPNTSFLRYSRKYEDCVTESKTPDIFSPEEWDTDLDSEEEEEEEDPGARKLYLDICHRLNVPPAAYLIRNVEAQGIDLKHRGLDAPETKAVAEALKEVLCVEQLDLEGNFMNGTGCKHLCHILCANQTLKELSIADNRLGNSCAAYIANMLSSNSTLHRFNAAMNNFDDNVAAVFADCLEDCKVKSLNLEGNWFSDRGGQILGPAISTNVYMDSLNLSWNHIRSGGAIAVAKGLKENVRLSTCDLSWNGFGEQGGLALADALAANTTLKHVNISWNRLTYPVAAKLAKSLLVNESLETLKLAHNPITTNGSLVIVEAILKSKATVMSKLDMSDNPVTYDFLKAVKDICRRRATFVAHYGPILRAGNTPEDIGKPAVDVLRLSKRPLMIIKDHITINDSPLFHNLMVKSGVKTDTCTADTLLQVLQEMDSSIEENVYADALSKLPRDENNCIAISEMIY